MSGRLFAALLIALTLLPGPAKAAPGIKETVEWITDKLIKNGGRQRVGDYKGDIYYAETVKAFGDHCRLVVTTTFLMDGDNVKTTFTVPIKDLKRVRRKPQMPQQGGLLSRSANLDLHGEGGASARCQALTSTFSPCPAGRVAFA